MINTTKTLLVSTIALLTFLNSEAQNIVSGNSGSDGLTLELKNNPGGGSSPYLLFDSRNGGANGLFMLRQELNNLSLNSYSTKWQGKRDLLTITTNGRIGVNTSNPSTDLDVRGLARFRKGSLDISFSTPSGRNGIIFDPDNSNNYSRLDIFNVPNTSVNSRFFSFKFNTDSHGLTLKKGGNVGIGTNNPGSYKLAVNGKVRAKEVVVDTGWSDFVFESDYHLLSIEEVEKFIKENGHLPDVPSEKEVAQNGVSLGTMDSKLLQKIEELTLYTIQLNKKIQKLEGLLNNK